MAFPQVAATNTSSEATPTNSHTVNLPASIGAGDLLIMLFNIPGSGSIGGTPNVSTPTDWTPLFNVEHSSFQIVRFVGFYKVASGSEGSTVSVTTTSTAAPSVHITYRVTGYSGTPEVATVSDGSFDNTGDPPNLAPSWGSADNLFIAAVGSGDNSSASSVSSYSTNYGNGLSSFADFGDGIIVASAQRQLAASSDNPGVITLASGDWHVGATIAIQPSTAPVVEQKSYQFFADGDELPHYDAGTAPDVTGWSFTLGASAGTTSTSVAAPYPATVNAGDLLIFCVAKDDDDAITDTTGGLTPIAALMAGEAVSNANQSLWVGYKIAVGNEDGGTHTFSGDAEDWETCCIRIPAGTFDPITPIDPDVGLAVNTGATDATVDTDSVVPTRSNGRVVAVMSVDTDPMDATFSPAGWTDRSDRDGGDITLAIATRDAATTAATQVNGASFGINSGDTSSSAVFVVNAPRVADGRTPLDDADTPVTLDVDTAYGVQARVYNSGAAHTEDTFKWQYNLNSAGWNDITASSDVVQTLATSDFADGDDVLEYLGGSGTFVTNNNAAEESTGTFVLAAALGSGAAFESHLNFQIIGSDVDDEDTIQLRLVEEDGTAFTTYTATPSITVNEESGTQNLTPSLYADGDTFFSATVARGAVGLAPSLYSDGDTFYAATVSAQYGLAPSLYSDDDTFFSATVAVGAVALSASLYQDADAFYAAAVSVGAVALTPSLYSDDDTFYSASIAQVITLSPSLYADDDTFHGPSVTVGSVSLSPSLYADGDTFFSPSVARGAVGLAPSLYSDDDTFHAATVARGAVALSPSLYQDADAFHSPVVSSGEFLLAPELYVDGDTFFSPSVAAGVITLAPSLHDDGDTFYAATLEAQEAEVAPPPLPPPQRSEGSIRSGRSRSRRPLGDWVRILSEEEKEEERRRREAEELARRLAEAARLDLERKIAEAKALALEEARQREQAVKPPPATVVTIDRVLRNASITLPATISARYGASQAHPASGEAVFHTCGVTQLSAADSYKAALERMAQMHKQNRQNTEALLLLLAS